MRLVSTLVLVGLLLALAIAATGSDPLPPRSGSDRMTIDQAWRIHLLIEAELTDHLQRCQFCQPSADWLCPDADQLARDSVYWLLQAERKYPV